MRLSESAREAGAGGKKSTLGILWEGLVVMSFEPGFTWNDDHGIKVRSEVIVGGETDRGRGTAVSG